MKKIFIILLAIALLGGVVSVGYADVVYTRSGNDTIKIKVITAMVHTLDSTIIAGNKIIGVSFADSSAGTAVLYDRATASHNAADIIAEVEVPAGETTPPQIFPLPYKLVNGLVTAQDNATGAITIYYE